MAIEELSARANDCYVGGTFRIIWMEAGDSAHQCGYIMEGDATSAEELIVCSATGIPFAACALQAALDIDTAVTAGQMYAYYLFHQGTELWLPHDTNTAAVLNGSHVYRSETVDGMLNAALATPLFTELAGWSSQKIAVCADKYLRIIT